MSQTPTPPVPPTAPSPTAPSTVAVAAPAVRPRRRWLTVLLTLLVFFAGMAAGSGATVAVVVHHIRYAIRHPDEAPARIAQVLSHRLKLSAEQRVKVEAILARHQPVLQQIRREVHPRLESIFDEVATEIGAVLTPEQTPRWERMLTNIRTYWLPPAPPPLEKGPTTMPR